ncbi:anther-specific proline-rich protein APG-like [Cervus canadensis]|uniref:anther-specific proline-rich protein APG-like n=1 Tax=Cervus canadensis TaxID=1574408 RepID=UPI001C9E8B05|nr:anther-specific proline-rich protein APG-like [Cervus canadensis]
MKKIVYGHAVRQQESRDSSLWSLPTSKKTPFLKPRDTPPPLPDTQTQSSRPELRRRPTGAQAARLPGRGSLWSPLAGRAGCCSPGPQASAAAGAPELSETGAGSPGPTDWSPGLLAPAPPADSAPAGRPPPRPGATAAPAPRARRPHVPAERPATLPFLSSPRRLLHKPLPPRQPPPHPPASLSAASRVVPSPPETSRRAKVPARPGIATPSPSLLSQSPSAFPASGRDRAALPTISRPGPS